MFLWSALRGWSERICHRLTKWGHISLAGILVSSSLGDRAFFPENCREILGPFHEFVWTEAAGMKDLGALPGENLSLALGINDRSQIVGHEHTLGTPMAGTSLAGKVTNH